MSSGSLLLGQDIDCDLIKSCDAVGLGPQRDFSRPRERFVRCREQRLSIELNGEMLSLSFQAQGVPFTAGDFDVDAIDLLPAAFDDAIKANVVFERVGARNVIVVAIEHTDSDTAGLIYVPSHRFEF